MSKLDITKLKSGDHFWVADREYEFDGPDNGISYRMPHYMAKDITWQKDIDAAPMSLKEEIPQYDLKQFVRCRFPVNQEIFSTKEEAVEAHIKHLEALIEIHTENYLRAKETLDNLMDEKGRFEKLR